MTVPPASLWAWSWFWHHLRPIILTVPLIAVNICILKPSFLVLLCPLREVVFHWRLHGLQTQKNETEEMHCGKTWICSLGIHVLVSLPQFLHIQAHTSDSIHRRWFKPFPQHTASVSMHVYIYWKKKNWTDDTTVVPLWALKPIVILKFNLIAILPSIMLLVM